MYKLIQLKKIPSGKNEVEVDAFNWLAELESKLRELLLPEKSAVQVCHLDAKKRFQFIGKTGRGTSEKLLEESKSTAKAIVELNELIVQVKHFDLLNRKGLNNPILFKSLAKFWCDIIKVHLDRMMILILIFGPISFWMREGGAV